MKHPKLTVAGIEDPLAALNFRDLNTFNSKDAFNRLSVEFREFGVIAATDQKVTHNLSFTPKDVIILHNSNNATVSFNYDKFDGTFLYVTSSAITNLRILVGRYE